MITTSNAVKSATRHERKQAIYTACGARYGADVETCATNANCTERTAHDILAELVREKKVEFNPNRGKFAIKFSN